MKTMTAEIKTYKTNATLFVGEESHNIDWDGYEFLTPEDYEEWIKEQLEPAIGCDNYDHVETLLHIATDNLRPTANK